MDRPYLDANVLFSAAWSATSRLRQLWTLADTRLISSARAVEEARRNLAVDRPSALPELDALVAQLELVPDPQPKSPMPEGIELPEKDRPIFLAAVAGQATHFITGDRKHFGAYRGRTFASVLVCTPADYFGDRGVL